MNKCLFLIFRDSGSFGNIFDKYNIDFVYIYIICIIWKREKKIEKIMKVICIRK